LGILVKLLTKLSANLVIKKSARLSATVLDKAKTAIDWNRAGLAPGLLAPRSVSDTSDGCEHDGEA